ncbi:hypothetical protein U9M48_029339 [Paspalum notatum var. saurae]|uniref:Transposase MuDR plant domain-containing protein n=1 Tax=Paspalum notatum var. saurae TaxID=547442 RepID=A0AAQ3TYQ2_PASNO
MSELWPPTTKAMIYESGIYSVFRFARHANILFRKLSPPSTPIIANAAATAVIHQSDANQLRISRFTAKLDDGTLVDVPRKCDKWDVDYRCYTLDQLEKDLAARVNWGSCQRPVFSEFDMSSFEERKIVDEASLALAFSDRMAEKKLLLFVNMEDKNMELMSISAVSVVTEGAMSNIVAENGSAQVDASNQVEDAYVIDWDSLEIVPIAEEQIGTLAPFMDDDAMYAFVGLTAEDEKARQDAETAAATDGTEAATTDGTDATEGEDLVVHDTVPGEESTFYDKEDPPMSVGSTYASMKEFRAALKQHAIKGQFELGTEKSCKDRFRGSCKAEGCEWAIVARLLNDGKQVRVYFPYFFCIHVIYMWPCPAMSLWLSLIKHCLLVSHVTVNKNDHYCFSIGKVRTKMASFHWVAEKAIPFLKKDPNMGIGYSTVWAGREIAAEKIYGTWEESFGLLFNFKAEVELRMPENGAYFHRFFCCFKPSIDGFLNGCRPYLSIDSTALNGRWNGHLPSATGIDGHNWIFSVAFGQKAIGNPPYLAISSDACKGIENAVKRVPLGRTQRMLCPLEQEFCKEDFEYHDYLMNKMQLENNEVLPWLRQHQLKWARSKFLEEIKCDNFTNNVAEVWNKWVKDLKDLPVAELADTLRSKFMDLFARRRRIGEKLDGHTMLPIVVRQLHASSRQLGHLRVLEGGRDEAEVTEVTASHKGVASVGKPCPHSLALITSYRNPRMEDFMHPYYSVKHFRLAYAGVIKPLPDKDQWPKVDLGFKVMPPLTTRPVGRQRKNRIPGWRRTRETSLGPKDYSRFSGANQEEKEGNDTDLEINTTPTRPVTRSQLQITIEDGMGTQAAATTSPGPVTKSMQLAATPPRQTKSPAKKTAAATNSPRPMTRSMQLATPPRQTKSAKKTGAKKITPRKGKK